MVSERECRKYMRWATRKWGVKSALKDDLLDCSAQVNSGDDAEDLLIELGPKSRATRAKFLSCLLHEIVHVYAAKMGLFDVFHNQACDDPREMTDKQLEVTIKTAWRAELWVEQTARKWMAEFFPGELFWFSYGRLKGKSRSGGWRAREKDWFEKNWLKPYRKEYRRRKLRRIDKRMRALKSREAKCSAN